MLSAALYKGTVFHKRYTPKVHQLKYRVFTLYADLDELESMSKSSWFFSLNRFNLLSFYEKDYGKQARPSGTRLKDHLLSVLDENGIAAGKVKTIKILAYPRVFGFIFNPLTVFYCFGENGEQLALIYEVRNTFKERHNYIFAVPDGSDFTVNHTAKKCFHVSPFFNREGEYDFSVAEPNEEAMININYKLGAERRLTACFKGTKRSFSDSEILKSCLATPFMTMKVVAGILFEALKLKLKGIEVFKHPENHEYQSSRASIQHQKDI